MSLEQISAAIVFLPLLGALTAGLSVRAIPDRLAQFVTCGPMVLSAILSGMAFYYVGLKGEAHVVNLAEWINTGTFKANWNLKVDALTAMMMVVVTWVSSVVHIYSVGYMSHDEHKPRFMAYLSLFTFFMLMLITSDNLVQLFLGWEGVGLCSYLLIGFWFKKPEANAAAIKAFLVNRVGDFGFALGVGAIFLVFGTVQFAEIFPAVQAHAAQQMNFLWFSAPALEVICLLLFMGAMGKSAQLFLHTWLPDAMEGPTPVSALIHAATMVTAGVFLVARCSPIFEYAPFALTIVTAVGALTAFFAATVGLVQNDIKRVIAYSTCSQLGYMFFACGVSAYAAGVFHLMTHGFFKALLFLGAGSVIHALSGEQDMRHMGGVWKKIPYTYACIWIGSLALAGFPPFAGYYSKDLILESAFATHNALGMTAFAIGAVAALFTAFYSWRLIFMTFHGAPRASKEVMSHIHESPPIMLAPLVLLVLGAVGAGYIGSQLFGMVDASGEFWKGAIFVLPENNVLEAAHHVPFWVKITPIVVGLLGIAVAYLFYIRRTDLPGKLAAKFPGLYQFLLNKWYFDELYDAIFVKPAKKLGHYLWKFWDEKIIDGLGPNGAAWISARIGQRTSEVQTGYLYHYAFAMLIGVLLLLSWVVWTQLKLGGM